MGIRKLDRYIASEVAIPMLLGLTVFTLMLLSGRALKLAELVVNKGVPLGDIGLLLMYILPSFMIFTLPLAFLLGVLLGVGRLSVDSEAIAIKAAGISLFSLLRPVMTLAIGAALVTALLTFVALPPSYGAFRDRLFELARSQATLGLQPGVFNQDFNGLTLYANGIDEQTQQLSKLFIADQRDAQRSSVITASSGRILSDPVQRHLVLRLDRGVIHRQAPAGSDYQLVRFSTYDIHLDVDASLSTQKKRKKKTKEMSLSELSQFGQQSDNPVYRAEFHRRFALPFAPLVLALVGIPLALRNHRSGKGAGFSVALLVFLGYYLLTSLAETLVESSVLPAVVAMWLPNTLYLLAGGWLFHRAAAEKPVWPALFRRTEETRQ